MNKLFLEKTYDSQTKEPRLTAVLIHGIASDSTTYRGLIEYLKNDDDLRDIRVVSFDLLGNGKSFKDDSLNYDYGDQLEALHNSIKKLNISTPLVLVGHSLGTFIVTRYADTYKNTVARLILISPPIYTPEDLKNPAFAAGIEAFKRMVSLKNPAILKEKSFINSMEKIVLAEDNYATLAKLKTPVSLVYGDEDQLIGAHNIPRVMKDNPKYIMEAVKTNGRHGVSDDKYDAVVQILREVLNEKR